MQLRMGWLNKRADWTTERFREHWRTEHAQLARQLPGLRGYVQNHVTDSEQRGIRFKRGPEQLDGFSQLWFDDDIGLASAFDSPLSKKLIDDEEHFIGRLRITTMEPTTVVTPPEHGRALKRMSILRRRADVSQEQFAHEWRAVHGPMVKRMPGILGYRQNLIRAREAPKGHVVDDKAWPVDGIVELWFEDTAAIDSAFSSALGQETMAHAETFIGEITTFLVEPVVIGQCS
jgi:uncharacterized protein (TIGR02118 family)